MSQIDITDLLADPDFVDNILIIHRIPTVDQYGANTVTNSSQFSIGSIQPISGKTLNRLPDMYRIANVMSFWVKGKIITDGSQKYPDLIQWKGDTYEVQTIFDWTNWGAGWTEGTCVKVVPAV